MTEPDEAAGGGPAAAGDGAAGVLVVSRTLDRCGVLGPGWRAVLWVQGCPLRCRGCVAPETLPFDAGHARPVAELADWLVGLPEIEGVTLSGGEPFAQARPLVELLDEVRTRRPELSAVAYSGFRLEALRRGTPAQRALLDRLDLLIDGPYVAARHGDLLWRGSDNQRLLPLTERYAEVADHAGAGAGIEVSLGTDNTFSWAGVPAAPGFRAHVETRLQALGYAVRGGAAPVEPAPSARARPAGGAGTAGAAAAPAGPAAEPVERAAERPSPSPTDEEAREGKGPL
ncbi:4Fe-4S single cluster domain-containing protein [Streptomyces sp. DSM 44915]|uniref:4Fe-4S single cluster domain-containing protein n=1 Tax=Streptomyces chisholmiae TaxID=3075540 RepID=A0ABU2JRA5_9ACTN|nr:4Fe-4S single cluster domain-containing protein [Streptomyces sp. DSM 44915]MDT0267509.1 4Fe-4S single cluster domain-containing protein [Streptomyces sp. DSM 44915]